ncbi:MAG: PRC-barrel domain-containing protein [Alphaproteobacteria bacterium]|nr:PRC-barrel domain-containing protein [Alphaproteobacteria bacterium]
MTRTLLSAASIIALMSASPAFADTSVSGKTAADVKVERTQNQDDMPTVTKEDMKRGWNKTKDAVSDTAEDVSDATKEAYESFKATYIDKDDKTESSTISIDMRNTATGMIGKSIYNREGEAIGKVHDIVLDSSGNAKMVVVADGAFFGLGKKAAFDYNVITARSADGDIISPLTEEMIDQAMQFSYEKSGAGDDVHVMPTDGYSVNTLLDGQLVDTAGKNLAEIDNITFQNGKATRLVVGFNKIMSMGGDRAALAFDTADLVKDGDGYDFRLTANQAAQFEAYKKAADDKS